MMGKSTRCGMSRGFDTLGDLPSVTFDREKENKTSWSIESCVEGVEALFAGEDEHGVDF